jgi:hypothetical protein
VFDVEELGSLARAFEKAILSIAVIHPELLDEIYDRILKIPEDDEVMDIIEYETGFTLLGYVNGDEQE